MQKGYSPNPSPKNFKSVLRHDISAAKRASRCRLPGDKSVPEKLQVSFLHGVRVVNGASRRRLPRQQVTRKTSSRLYARYPGCKKGQASLLVPFLHDKSSAKPPSGFISAKARLLATAGAPYSFQSGFEFLFNNGLHSPDYKRYGRLLPPVSVMMGMRHMPHCYGYCPLKAICAYGTLPESADAIRTRSVVRRLLTKDRLSQDPSPSRRYRPWERIPRVRRDLYP